MSWAIAVAIAAAFIAAPPAFAQASRGAPSAKQIPRAPDGKPDFAGFFNIPYVPIFLTASVIDTRGLKGAPWTWLDTAGHRHSDQLHVIERFSRTPDDIEYEYTVDDPIMYAKPWTPKRVLTPLQITPGLPGLLEYSCSENNRDVRHLVPTKPALEQNSRSPFATRFP